MNKVKMGREFEKEAYEILKKEFDEVEWLSEKHASTFDFKCIKDGKELYGDAKYKKQIGKPCLTHSQKEADFLIAKVGEEIYTIWKNEFDKRVCIANPLDPNITTIQIYREDLKVITSQCKKNENLRDKLHKIIQKELHPSQEGDAFNSKDLPEVCVPGDKD